MAQIVNFAHQLSKRRSQLDKKDRQLFKQASLALAFGLGLTALVLGVRFFTSASLARAEKEEANLTRTLESQKDAELEYLTYARKLSLLASLFTNRQAKQEAFARFRFLFGEGVSITGLTYNVRSNALSFQLRAENVFKLEEVLTRLSQPDVAKDYPYISKDSLARSEDGAYQMAITVNLAKTRPEAETKSKPDEQIETNLELK